MYINGKKVMQFIKTDAVNVDDAFSETSENALQNKVITAEFKNKFNKSDLLNLFPVGTIITKDVDVSPATYIGGKWEKLPEGYALWTASSGAGDKISAGLPNITGSFRYGISGVSFLTAESTYGAFSTSETNSVGKFTFSNTVSSNTRVSFNANSGATTSGIYGNSTTVQPPAYKVYAWRRYE